MKFKDYLFKIFFIVKLAKTNPKLTVTPIKLPNFHILAFILKKHTKQIFSLKFSIFFSKRLSNATIIKLIIVSKIQLEILPKPTICQLTA